MRFRVRLLCSAGNGLLKERDSRGREYGPAFMRRYMDLRRPSHSPWQTVASRFCPRVRLLPGSAGELRRTAFYRRDHAAAGLATRRRAVASGVIRLQKRRSS